MSYQTFKSINKVPQGIAIVDTTMTSNLDYKYIKLPVSIKDYKKIKQIIIFVLMYFAMKFGTNLQ